MAADPPRPDPCTCLALRKAARHVSQFYDRHLAACGLRTTQFSLLARLRHRGPGTIQALAEDMVMDRTTLARNLGPLERDGLVAVEVDPQDRRGRIARLTEAGEARYAEARRLWATAQSAFDTAFGAPDSAALRRSLAALVATGLGEVRPQDS